MSDPLFQTGDGATPLDPDEAEGLLFPHVQTRGQLNELENANIVQGQAWLARQKTPDLFSEEFTRTLHRRLFGEVWSWAGTFRSTEKNIGVAPFAIAAELRKLLEDTKIWVEQQVYPSLEIAARFHHRMLLIHPFPNGNGRHSRIMTDALLSKFLNRPKIAWAGGLKASELQSRREEYISSLREADAGSYKKLLSFLSAGA